MAASLTLIAALALNALVLPATASAAPDNGDFQLEVEKVKSANRKAATALERSGALQAMIAEVNAKVALPESVPLVISDDFPRQIEDGGPAYYPDVELEGGQKLSFIAIPAAFLTEAVDRLRRQVRGTELGPTEAMIFSVEFVVAHEIGHALVNKLQIPITGREEDAVDGFAAYLLIDNPSFGPLSAIAAAAFFDAVAQSRGKLTPEDFADEHSILEQRVYQFLCWTYGFDRARFGAVVGKDGLPRERAGRCEDEWQQVSHAWSTLLAPYAPAPA